MRIVISLVCSVVMTLVLFLLMMNFIRREPLPEQPDQSDVFVNIEQVDQGTQHNKSGRSEKIEMNQQQAPQLNSQLLENMAVAMPMAQTAMELSIESQLLSVEALPVLQKNWVQPSQLISGAGSDGLDGQFKGPPKSIRKITPVSTRMPQIPKVAWDNKINGWVLLSFTVTSKGLVKDIRILDASPRGVFEEYAVLAAKQWRYAHIKSDRYVSQKIEFEWENYPYNWE